MPRCRQEVEDRMRYFERTAQCVARPIPQPHAAVEREHMPYDDKATKLAQLTEIASYLMSERQAKITLLKAQHRLGDKTMTIGTGEVAPRASAETLKRQRDR